jgi:hypothetical protein
VTCKVERWGDEGAPAGQLPGALKSMTFHCDHEGCEASPTDTEIIAANGLNAMGWDCRGGKHYCPKHRRTKQ